MQIANSVCKHVLTDCSVGKVNIAHACLWQNTRSPIGRGPPPLVLVVLQVDCGPGRYLVQGFCQGLV